jgi:hypothetical protein
MLKNNFTCIQILQCGYWSCEDFNPWAGLSLAPSGLTLKNSTFCPHSVFMRFVWIWEQTAIISLYSINWLVFITRRSVFTARYVLPMQCICVFCLDLRTNSDYFSTLNELTAFWAFLGSENINVLCGDHVDPSVLDVVYVTKPLSNFHKLSSRLELRENRRRDGRTFLITINAIVCTRVPSNCMAFWQ